MAYMFPSDEWLQAYKDALNGEVGKAWQKAAEKWEGDFLFVVEADDQLSETTFLYIDLWHGQCRDAKTSTDESALPKSELQYRGTYGNWVKLLNGKIDPIKGILMRKFKLVGNKTKVMRSPGVAKELVKTAQKIDTLFQ